MPLALSVAMRASLAGIVASVVLFGFTTETQRVFYALLTTSLAVYAIARGEVLVRSVLQYLSSPTLAARWAFVAWAAASLFWSSRGNSVERVITLLEIHAVGLVFYDAARNLRLARWVLASVFVASVVGAGHALSTGTLTEPGRLVGMYRNPNLLAMTLMVGLAAFVSGAGLGRTALLRWTSQALALVVVGAVLASASLKGAVGVAAIWAIGLGLRATRRRTAIHVALACGGAVAAAAAFRGYWDRLAHRVGVTFSAVASEAGLSNSLVERLRFARQGLAFISEAPFRGHGPDAFSWLSGQGGYAHNNAIEIGVSLGLLGIVLFHALHVHLVRRALSVRGQRGVLGNFVLVFVPTLILLDAAAVSYLMKLPTLLLLLLAGWSDRRRDRLGSS